MTDDQSHPLPRSALLFMATVEEARKTNEGPFRALAPIFRIALEHQRGELLNVSRAVATLNPIFGSAFNQDAAEAFLPHLQRLGWLSGVRTADGRIVYTVSDSLPPFDQETSIDNSHKKLSALYDAFLVFTKQSAPLLEYAISRDNFEWQLFRWATSLDGSDKAELQAHARKIAEGGAAKALSAFLDDPHRFSKVDRSLSVELAGFVRWLALKKRPEIADIAGLTELGLAIEFLEELRSPTSVQATERIDTKFVLDAPVLLDFFGLSGQGRRDSAKQMIDALRKCGAHFMTLSHCVEELGEILKTVVAKAPRERYGLTGDALRSNSDLLALARSIASQPDQAIKLAGFEIVNFDPNSPLNAAHFPDQQIDRFRNTATWHDQYKTNQKQRDAYSIAFVARRRAKQHSSDFFHCGYVLVTRNSTFTAFSEHFLRRNLGVPDYAVGPAIETKTLAALVWMRLAAEKIGDLPQLHLISACDRILASNRMLLRKADEKLAALKGEEASAAILSSQQAVLDLVVSTGGNHEVIDAAEGEAVVAALTTSAEVRGREIERKIADAELGSLLDKLSKKEALLSDAESQARAAGIERLRIEAEARAAREAADALAAAGNRRTAQTAEEIIETADRWSGVAIGTLWATTTIYALLGQFFVWEGRTWWLTSYTNLVLGASVVAATFFSAFLGIRFFQHGRIDGAGSMRGRLTNRLIRWHLLWVMPAEERSRVAAVLVQLRPDLRQY